MPVVREVTPYLFDFPRIKRVGAYCRVSSTIAPQMASLANQISYFVKMIPNQPGWRLSDIYTDVKSGDTMSSRPELQRLLTDCRQGALDVVIVKNISRLSRDTVELLTLVREMRNLGIEVVFDQEMLSTAEEKGELILTLLEAIAQSENDSRSKDVRWGILHRATDGSSGLYKRRCYGYRNNEEGHLEIDRAEAPVVRRIFEMYLSGESLAGIIRSLENDDVKTATGKDKWSKRAVDCLLSNEKYCGNVMIFKTYTVKQYMPYKVKRRKKNDGKYERYYAIANHPAIISEEMFNAVQAEKARRSNVDENGNRTKTRYSAKRRTLL